MPFDSVNYQPTDPILRHLTEARRMIDDPDRWWGEGKVCRPDMHCAALAIERCASATGDDPMPALHHLKGVIAPGAEFISAIFHFNDTHTHADVLALFDRAIAARRLEIASKATTEA